MRTRFSAALLFSILAVGAHAEVSPADRAANPKAAALAQMRLGAEVRLYGYQSDDGAYTAYLYPDSVRPLGGGWYAAVSRHRSQRGDAEPYMRVLDWVSCNGDAPYSVMSAMALFNPDGSLHALKDAHPYAQPAELNEETIRSLNAVDGEEQHTQRMVHAVCSRIGGAK